MSNTEALPEPSIHIAFNDSYTGIRFWTANAGHAAEWSHDNGRQTTAFYTANQMREYRAAPAQPAARVSQAVMVRLSKALGNPTEAEADPGETVEDALIRMAAQKLAQPAASGEPVALIRTWHKGGEQHAELWDWGDGLDALPDGDHKVYTTAQPAPALVPLNEERLNAAGLDYALADSFSSDKAEWVAQDIADAFKAGARAAERHHSITAKEAPTVKQYLTVARAGKPGLQAAGAPDSQNGSHP